MKVKRPTLFVDKQKAEKNISRIAGKAQVNNTELIPHFKTHQSLGIGEWFRPYKIKRITVSSISMAKYFADGGWKEIYIAFPVNLNELDEILDLASRTKLTLLVNDPIQFIRLNECLQSIVEIKIEIETGSLRSGISPEETELIESLLMLIQASQHRFAGFYSHFGNTYSANSKEEVNSIYQTSLKILEDVRDHFITFDPELSLGDTPSASILNGFAGIKSVHAGNYVFYDLTQSQIGVCDEDDIAVALAVPVISKNKDRNELIVYGGGIHLSKEVMQSEEFNVPIHGKIVEFNESCWSKSLEGCFVRAISQEHGVVRVTDEVFNRLYPGDTIGILPVHSCMTADCMRGYSDLKGSKIDHFQGLGVK